MHLTDKDKQGITDAAVALIRGSTLNAEEITNAAMVISRAGASAKQAEDSLARSVQPNIY